MPYLISRRNKDIAVPDSHRKVTMAGPSVATNGMMRRVRKHGDLNRNVRHGVFSHAQNSTWPAWSPGEKRQERHPGFECHDSHNVYYVKPDAMLEMFMSVHFHDPVTILPKTSVALKFMALPYIPLS